MVARGGFFIPIVSTEGINQIKKGKLKEKVKFYAHAKRLNTFFKRWMQFHVYHYTQVTYYPLLLEKESNK